MFFVSPHQNERFNADSGKLVTLKLNPVVYSVYVGVKFVVVLLKKIVGIVKFLMVTLCSKIFESVQVQIMVTFLLYAVPLATLHGLWTGNDTSKVPFQIKAGMPKSKLSHVVTFTYHVVSDVQFVVQDDDVELLTFVFEPMEVSEKNKYLMVSPSASDKGVAFIVMFDCQFNRFFLFWG